ncbi:AfsA-related hotdog domain-containing protein [Mycetohabitans rhizoxinica]|uniref:AfsA-related hotdog domain-containing protein n=1 Tax=Mycetohabitans rhizoxinica TaxID=412963 RepID=UPI0030D1536F
MNNSVPCSPLVEGYEIDSAGRRRLQRRLVHKSELQHVFVERIDPVPPTGEGQDRFVAPLIIEPDHPFFFEHEIDHVPGLMLVEATRQVGTAISHLFYEVPFGVAFVLDEFNVSYAHFAELSAPLAVHFTVVEKYYRKRTLSGLQAHTEWHQAGLRVGTMDVRWRFMPPAILARLRRTSTMSIGITM